MAFSLPQLIPASTGVSSANVSSTISSIANTVLGVLFVVAGVAAVIYLTWSGIQYITSRGEQDKAKAARTGIINAVIGIVIVVATYGIIRLAVTIGNAANKAIGGNNQVGIDSNAGGGNNDPGTESGGSVTTGGDTTGGGGSGGGGSTPSCSDSVGTEELCLLGYQYYATMSQTDASGTSTVPINKWCRYDSQDYCLNDASGLPAPTVVGTDNWYYIQVIQVGGISYKWCRDSSNCLTQPQFDAYRASQANAPTPTPTPSDEICPPNQTFDQGTGICVNSSQPVG